MTITEIAWCAGLFEGEGCISLKRSTPGRSITLHLASTDLDVLERFQHICGGFIRSKIRNTAPSHWKPMFEWKLHKISDCYSLLLTFLPYLCERRAYCATNALDQLDGI